MGYLRREALAWEGYFPNRPEIYKEDITSMLARLANAVEIAHGMMAGLERALQFLHVPAPKHHDDEAYYAPLAALRLPEGCELHLGVIHHDDRDGDRRALRPRPGSSPTSASRPNTARAAKQITTLDRTNSPTEPQDPTGRDRRVEMTPAHPMSATRQSDAWETRTPTIPEQPECQLMFPKPPTTDRAKAELTA